MTQSKKQFRSEVVAFARAHGWLVLDPDHLGAVDEGELIVECELDVHPRPTGRPRFARGHAFTPPETRTNQEAVALLLRAAKPVFNDRDDIAVSLVFRTKTRQRRDLDNMVKLVLDAANGVLWGDDQQVVRVDAEVIRGHAAPGISIRAEVAHGVPRECGRCRAPIGAQKARRGYYYCSPVCYADDQKRATEPRARPSFCDRCGVSLNDKRAHLCRSCWRLSRADLAPTQSEDSEPGFPDLVLVRGSVVLFAELKVGANVPTAAQAAWLAALAGAGQRAAVWRPEDWDEIRAALTA